MRIGGKEIEIGPEETPHIYLAATIGNVRLALEHEDLGLSDEEDSLTDARRLRPIVLAIAEAAIEAARGGTGGEA